MVEGKIVTMTRILYSRQVHECIYLHVDKLFKNESAIIAFYFWNCLFFRENLGVSVLFF